MYKQIGSIFLVAGTCIGSGMIALPMVLAKIGIIPSIILMLIMWATVYYTSLISLELNLQAGRGLSLGELGQKFSGQLANKLGIVSIKTLSYSLLAAYIYGGSSILQKLLNKSGSIDDIASYYAIILFIILLMPIKLIDYVNRVLFMALLVIVAVMIIGLLSNVTWSNLPLFLDGSFDITNMASLIPVVFTSFGFQVIFHTLTNYLDKDKKALKRVFLYGSLIPVVVYVIWTCSVLGSIHHMNPNFYLDMVNNKVEVGDLVKELSGIAQLEYVQLLVWWISLLAIITSVLGVGVGLYDSLCSLLGKSIPNTLVLKISASGITVLPAYLVAVLVSNAFITVLGFAGMILVLIAILLPIYLLYKIKNPQYHYSELNARWLIIMSGIFGIIIIACEMWNIL